MGWPKKFETQSMSDFLGEKPGSMPPMTRYRAETCGTLVVYAEGSTHVDVSIPGRSFCRSFCRFFDALSSSSAMELHVRLKNSPPPPRVTKHFGVLSARSTTTDHRPPGPRTHVYPNTATCTFAWLALNRPPPHPHPPACNCVTVK